MYWCHLTIYSVSSTLWILKCPKIVFQEGRDEIIAHFGSYPYLYDSENISIIALQWHFFRFEMTKLCFRGCKIILYPHLSRLMTKPTKWPLLPPKTQISLGIKKVAKDLSFLHADSEDLDQTGLMPRLIWVFAGHTCHFVGFVVLRIVWAVLAFVHILSTMSSSDTAEVWLTLQKGTPW